MTILTNVVALGFLFLSIHASASITISSDISNTTASNVVFFPGGSEPVFYYSNISNVADATNSYYLQAATEKQKCSSLINPRCVNSSDTFVMQAKDSHPSSGTPSFYLSYSPYHEITPTTLIYGAGVIDSWTYSGPNIMTANPGIKWSTICTSIVATNPNAGIDGQCRQTGQDAVIIPLYLIADANGNGVYDPGESIVSFNLVFQSTIPIHSSAKLAEGFFQFQTYAGDGECVVINSVADTQFNSTSENGGTGARFVRFYYTTGPDVYSLALVSPYLSLTPATTPNLPYVDLFVDSNGSLIPDSVIDGLKNGVNYYFRAAIVDNAGNIGYLTPPEDEKPNTPNLTGAPKTKNAHACRPEHVGGGPLKARPH